MRVTQARNWPKVLSVVVVVLLGMIASHRLMAVVDIREFNTPEDEARYHVLIDELRCPKCQNQNLSGSDSQIAQDLRRELYRMIDEGHNDNEIKDFMVARYGDYVLYRPRLSAKTYALWFGPAILLLIGVVALVLVVRKRTVVSVEPTEPMSNDELNKLQTMLGDSNKDEK